MSLQDAINKDLERINANLDNDLKNDLIASAIELKDIAKGKKIKINIPKELNLLMKKYYDNEYFVDDKVVKEYNDNYDFNLALSKLGEDINQEYIFDVPTPRYRTKISTNEILTVVANFFRQYDKDIYDYYENFIINGNFYLIFNDRYYDGFTISKTPFSDAYVFVKNRNNLLTCFVLAHEIIHAYLSEVFLCDNKLDSKRISATNLDEVYSFYIEYVLSLYLEKNNYLCKEVYKYVDFNNSYMLDELLDYNELLMLNKPDFDDRREVCTYLDYDAYSKGKVIGYNFLLQYGEDIDKAKENITRFMLGRMKHNLKYMLNNYGLKEEEIVDKEVLVRAMNRDF